MSELPEVSEQPSVSQLLTVEGLEVRFPGLSGDVVAVDGVSFAVGTGEILGIVGESGSGKSTVLSSCIKLVPAPGRITKGSIRWRGTNVTDLPEKGMRAIRGRQIGMIFQDPFSALHPSLTVGRQIDNAIRDHTKLAKQARRALALEALSDAGVPHPQERLGAYPHHLSGGLCQRVVIAMAIVNRPELLLADEPTTALDVTVQAEILDLLARITAERRLSVIFVTHNFGIVAHLCERTIVMQRGRIVEEADTRALFRRPQHRYTRDLLDAVPRVDVSPAAKHQAIGAPQAAPTLRCVNVTKHFSVRRWFGSSGVVHALDDVSLDVYAGETLGLVGESGAGKTTLARCMVNLTEPTSGHIFIGDEDIHSLRGDRLRALRRKIQFVFQNPYAALNPRMTVYQQIAEPMVFHDLCEKSDLKRRVATQLDLVGLPTGLAERYPGQLSGGERQRVVIARALAVEPSIVIADEPVSALDVSIQTQVIELFAQLQRELNLTLVIVAHDLGLVRNMCDRVAVMYLGQIVEVGAAEDVFLSPRHPYTSALIRSAPIPDPEAARRTRMIAGDAPSAVDPPPGCRFHPRCPRASDVCRTVEPVLEIEGAGNDPAIVRRVACFHRLTEPQAVETLER